MGSSCEGEKSPEELIGFWRELTESSCMNYTIVQEHRKLQLTARGLGKDIQVNYNTDREYARSRNEKHCLGTED